MTTKSEILRLLRQQGALKDSELARLLGVTHQQVNQAARGLETAALITRVPGPDGVIRNRARERGDLAPLSGETSPRRVARSPAKRRLVRSEIAVGTPVARDDLNRLGFEEFRMKRIPSADVLEAGLIGWDTVGEVPAAPGLYCFVGRRKDSDDLRVFYVGMTTNLWMVTKGQLPGSGARGGQRYGRPKHAGATRQRVNAEIAQMSGTGWTFAHWLRALEAPADGSSVKAQLRIEEARLIDIWDLRVAGWNRG